MVKFIKKLFWGCFPFYLIGLVVCFFEPHGFFKNNYNDGTRPLFAIFREIEKKPKVVMLGDSLFVHLQSPECMQAISEYVDLDSFANLAWGGAQGHELQDMFDYLIKQDDEVETIYIDVYYYTVQKNTQGLESRVKSELKFWKNPLCYIYDRQVIGESFLYLWRKLPSLTIKAEAADKSTQTQSVFDTYAQVIYKVCEGYEIDNNVMDRYEEIANTCNIKGIKLIFVIPPIHKSIWEQVIYPLELTDELEEYKTRLKSLSTVIDMEEYDSFSNNDDYFSDGHHKTKEGDLLFTKRIFEFRGDLKDS